MTAKLMFKITRNVTTELEDNTMPLHTMGETRNNRLNQHNQCIRMDSGRDH